MTSFQVFYNILLLLFQKNYVNLWVFTYFGHYHILVLQIYIRDIATYHYGVGFQED